MSGSVQVNVPGKRVTGALLTLSIGGCFVTGVPKLKVGGEHRMFLIVNGAAEPMQVTARVLYNLPAMDGHEAGAGFSFTKVVEEVQKQIDVVVQKSGNLYQILLGLLTDSTSDPHEIEKLRTEAGIEDGLTTAQLRWRVVQSVSRFRA